jgi:hypothetical protein
MYDVVEAELEAPQEPGAAVEPEAAAAEEAPTPFGRLKKA